jgi:hypothetical protein
MNRRQIGMTAALMLFMSAWASTTMAQSCTTTMTCATDSLVGGHGCVPILPKTAYNGTWDGPFEWIATVRTPMCAPSPARKCPWCGGAPIDFASGDTYFTEVDLKLPGLGGGLTLSRTWNSDMVANGVATGMFGRRRTSSRYLLWIQ